MDSPLKIVDNLNAMNRKTLRPLKSAGKNANPSLRKAKALLEREEARGKKSRLECLLVQQYVGKYGSKNPVSHVNSIIKTHVHNFLENSGEDIDNSSIDLLERKVRELASNAKVEIVSAREERTKSHEEARRSVKFTKQNANNTTNNGMKGSGSQPTVDLNNWAVVNACLAIKDRDQKQREIDLQREKKMKYREVLSDQLHAKEKEKLAANEMKKKDLIAVSTAYEQYKEEEFKVKNSKDKVISHERTLRLAQIQENKARIQQERQAKIDQEKLEMLRAKDLQNREAEKLLERKEIQKRQMDVVKYENEINKAIKAEAKKEQAAYEKRLNAEYEARLAKEEHDRNNAFAKRIQKLGQAEKRFEATTGVKAAEERELNEQKIKREIEQKYKADEEKERMKDDKRRRELEKTTQFNLEMADRKKKREMDEKASEVNIRIRAVAAAQEAKDEEIMKRHVAKQKNDELKKVLDMQVEQRRSKIKNAQALTDEEQQFNRSIIQKIRKDPNLFDKVVTAVQPGPTSYSSFAW